MRRQRSDRYCRGIALITAMLILFLATVTVVAMAAKQRRGLGLDAILHERAQADEYAHGLERWVQRRLLVDDRDIDSGMDNWATPLPVTRVTGGEVQARVVDLAGRFNLNNLMPTADVSSGVGAQPNQAMPSASAGQGIPSAGQRAPIDEHKAPNPGDAGFEDFYDFIPPKWFVEEFVKQRALRHGGGGQTQIVAIPDRKTADSYRRRFQRLLRQLGLRAEMVDAIQDWLDADTEVRYPAGAEDDYYLARKPAYRAANRPFEDVSELLLVRGISLDDYRRLRPYVSALPTEVPINVNTAPPELVKALSPDIDDAVLSRILERRAQMPYTSIADLDAFLGGRNISLDVEGLAVSSSFFLLQGRIAVGDYSRIYRSRFLRLGPQQVVLLSRGYGDGGS